MSVGPRLRVGPVVLNAGVRFGAMFMNVTEVGPTREGREFSAVDGVFALDVGAQWRPTRWLQLDASVGQDFVTSLGATTFSVAASFGWSRGPALTQASVVKRARKAGASSPWIVGNS